MDRTEELQALVRAAFSPSSSGEFRPCAYFDEQLDCIRVIARDCSVCEERIDEHFTVLVDNYFERGGRGRKYVGFTFKGAKHFCQEHGLSLAASIKMSAFLDAIVASFPSASVEMLVDLIARPLFEEEKIDRIEVPAHAA